MEMLTSLDVVGVSIRLSDGRLWGYGIPKGAVCEFDSTPLNDGDVALVLLWAGGFTIGRITWFVNAEGEKEKMSLETDLGQKQVIPWDETHGVFRLNRVL